MVYLLAGRFRGMLMPHPLCFLCFFHFVFENGFDLAGVITCSHHPRPVDGIMPSASFWFLRRLKNPFESKFEGCPIGRDFAGSLVSRARERPSGLCGKPRLCADALKASPFAQACQFPCLCFLSLIFTLSIILLFQRVFLLSVPSTPPSLSLLCPALQWSDLGTALGTSSPGNPDSVSDSDSLAAVAAAVGAAATDKAQIGAAATDTSQVGAAATDTAPNVGVLHAIHRIFPSNISGTYKGTWRIDSNQTSIPLLDLRRKQGNIIFQIKATETARREVHFLQACHFQSTAGFVL